MKYGLLCSVAALMAAGCFPTLAAEAEKDAFTKALTEGKVLFDARYRYEYVDQDGLPENADANTLRTRLGYETGELYNTRVLVEFENITTLGGEQFNDTINGKTNYPVVADPEDTALNRLQLTYTGLPDTSLTLGRQVINLDNQRFVGAVGWRQNDQTFDAASIRNQLLPGFDLFYAYIHQVNRVFGTESPQGSWDSNHIHLMNATYTNLPFGKITGYSYLLDIPDAQAFSSATYGARFEGKHNFSEKLTGLLDLEYAKQVEYADNPSDFSFDYYVVNPGIRYGAWTLRGLYESIEGDGTNAMQFALGTNHAFDGWVDKFLTTPANGLVDASISLGYTHQSANTLLNGLKATVAYHDFSAERGSMDYGTEWDGVIEQTFAKYYTVGMKLGYYEADDLFTDTAKIMPYVQVKF